MKRNKTSAITVKAIEKLERNEFMDWSNIYIVGNPGFKKEAAKKLEHSELKYMPGYLGSDTSATDYDMYWVDKSATLRTFKEAIGAKAIWKYRIKFYESLEKFIASQDTTSISSQLTDQDMALIEEMRNPKKQVA